MSDIRQIVDELIKTGREGTYWDFKRKHHENKAELLHDLLCLANAKHPGDRFLIYGVENRNLEVVGVEGNRPRRTQNDLIGFLRDNSKSFEGGRTPEVNVYNLNIDEKEIDVVRVLDKPFKPYRLLEKYSDGGKMVFPSIYSRTEDRNVPIDKSASLHDVEEMYRERFGLNLKPIDHLLRLLTEGDRWKTWENGLYYHDQFPEFTYRYDDEVEPLDEEWVRGEIGHHLERGSLCSTISFQYFGTKIGEVGFAHFDHGKKQAVRPDWAPYKGGRIYYYEAGSLRYAMQTHLVQQLGRDDSLGLLSAADRTTFNIPILSSQQVKRLWDAPPLKVLTDHNEQNATFSKAIRASNSGDY